MKTDHKVVLCGDYAVGKTTLIERFFRGTFLNSLSSTIGASFKMMRRTVVLDDIQTEVVCGIWDTAGQERFSSLLPMYFRGAQIILYCWAANIPFDPQQASKTIKFARESNRDAYIFVVVTKADFLGKDEKIVALEEYCSTEGLIDPFYTSAKTGRGVEELFDRIALDLAKLPNLFNESRMVTIKKEESTGCCTIC